jgi:hypothetical protein
MPIIDTAGQGIRRVGRQITAQTRYDAARSARNNIVLYRQKFCRITGELHCVHLEWRARGRVTLRRLGINTAKDLFNFDHRAFWQKRMLLIDFQTQRLGRAFRNSGKGHRRRAGRDKEDRLDGRTGHVLINSHATLQEVVDRCRSIFKEQSKAASALSDRKHSPE